MKQHELSSGDLLDENGNLNEAGYSYSLVKRYDRNAIKANKLRIKEWDYYYFGDNNYGIALTIADNSYMSMASVSLLDFINKKEKTISKIEWFPKGRTNLPSTSENGDVSLIGKGYQLEFINNNGERKLFCHIDRFIDKDSFECNLIVKTTNNKSMVIATPFYKDKHFYYNQKINLLEVTSGEFKIGNKLYEFNNKTLGVLDWGRGVWTYKNTWYWSSLNSFYQGHNIGFNLGYGFGDTSRASENMFFFDKEAYKLDDVTFNIPKTNKGKDLFLEKWTITSKNKDINLIFEPILDRASDTNVLLIRSNQHQVFGKFSGTIKVDGKTYTFDNLIGFAEKVYNKW